MTASPSQFGGSTTTLPDSGIASIFWFVAHQEIFAAQLVLVAPAPMHPQPQRRMPPHVHLEDIRAALREVANRIRSIGARRIDGMLVDETVPTARQRQREHRDDGRPGAQRKRRKRRCRRRWATEEIDV